MPDTPYLHTDGIIYHEFGDAETAETIALLHKNLTALSQKQRAQKKTILILFDLAKIKTQTAGARKAGSELLKQLDYDKLAICQGSVFIKHLALFIISMSGQGERVWYFDTKEGAITWLKK